MSTIKKVALCLAVLATMNTAPLMANEAGDIKVRVGAAGVYPTGDSGNIDALGSNAKVEADDAWSLGLSLTYMLTDNIGVGLLGAYPFKHDIKGKGSISGLDKVAEVTQLPPTLTLQYVFNNSSAFTPFVGAGVNYTYFWDEKGKGALKNTTVDVNNSWGYALEAGLDYDINDKWMVGAQIYYLNIETRAHTAVGNFNVDINPMTYLFTAGYKF